MQRITQHGRSTGEPPNTAHGISTPPRTKGKCRVNEIIDAPASNQPAKVTLDRSPSRGSCQSKTEAAGQQATAPTNYGQWDTHHQTTNCHPHIGSTDLLRDPPAETTTPSPLPEFMQRVGYPNLVSQDEETKHTYVLTDDYDQLITTDIGANTERGLAPDSPRSWPYPTAALTSAQANAYESSVMAYLTGDQSLRPVITTNLKVTAWDTLATGHSDDHWILDAVRHGFPIQYSGPPRLDPPLLYNHASATAHARTINDYIKKETAHGALHGPFRKPPFTPWMTCSPMMTREKPDTTERRVIVDLSYPDGGINAHIAPHTFNGRPAVHNLPTVELAITAINRLSPGEISMAVIDLSRAYRQLPVPPADWPLLGVQFSGQYYFDGRLPFGARLSAFAMQSVAQFIVRALEQRKITAFMYLDDIIIIAGALEVAVRNYGDALALLASMGLQVAAHKLQPPGRAVTWLGIHIDMEHNRLSIPQQKLDEIHKCLAAAARQPKITIRHLQSILGYINHLAKVVRAARVFISRLLAALRSAKDDIIIVTPAVKADLGWFIRYLHSHNAREVIPHNRTVLRIWADSSLRGAGATDANSCYAYEYPKSIAASHHITQLEALNVLAAVRTFVTREHQGGTIVVYGDNMASMSSYSSGRARDTVLAACCRAMWYHAADTQTRLVFDHIPGETMVLPDALSRASFDPALARKARHIVASRALSEVRVNKDRFSYSAFL